MAKAAKPVPDGYHTLTPYIVVRNAEEAAKFYGRAFGAEPLFSMPGPDGKVIHGEMKIGNSVVMFSEENLAWGSKSPLTLGGSPSSLLIYTEDADGVFKQAVDAGCTVKMPLADQFWGDRWGQLVDPYGHTWQIATHKEDLTPEEIAERQKKAFAEMSGPPA